MEEESRRLLHYFHSSRLGELQLWRQHLPRRVYDNKGGGASWHSFSISTVFFDLFDFPIVNNNNVLCKHYRINCKTHVQVSAKCYNKYNVKMKNKMKK